MIEVISDNYKTRRLTFNQWGAYWNGRWTTPISLTVTRLDGSKDTGRTIGGAVIGGVLAGGAGAIVGALASGNKGKTLFVLKTIEGDELLCRCPAKEYTRIAGLMQRFLERATDYKEFQRRGTFVSEGRKKTFILSLLFGPIYFGIRFGKGAFILSVLFVFCTIGYGWLALPFISIWLHNNQRRDWIGQYGGLLNRLDIVALRNERRASFESEFGIRA